MADNADGVGWKGRISSRNWTLVSGNGQPSHLNGPEVTASALTGKVDAAQKTTNVSGQSNDHGGQEFQRQKVHGKRGS